MGEKKNWLDAVSETIDKAAKAANEAWDGTADLRKDAWEKTKTAASSASDALDQGVEQAKAAYEGSGESDQQEPQTREAPEDDRPPEIENAAEPDET